MGIKDRRKKDFRNKMVKLKIRDTDECNSEISKMMAKHSLEECPTSAEQKVFFF